MPRWHLLWISWERLQQVVNQHRKLSHGCHLGMSRIDAFILRVPHQRISTSIWFDTNYLLISIGFTRVVMARCTHGPPTFMVVYHVCL